MFSNITDLSHVLFEAQKRIKTLLTLKSVYEQSINMSTQKNNFCDELDNVLPPVSSKQIFAMYHADPCDISLYVKYAQHKV